MKWFKIAKDLKINIESIYALGKENNQSQLDEWDKSYNKYINDVYKNPIELEVDGYLYTPDFNENIEEETLNKYMDALRKYIFNIIGEKPDFYENYFSILTTGNKVYLTKEVYDIINEYIDNTFNVDVYKNETKKDN